MFAFPLHHYSRARLDATAHSTNRRSVADEWAPPSRPTPRPLSRAIGRSLVMLGTRLLDEQDDAAMPDRAA